jgi:hypothetical protein
MRKLVRAEQTAGIHTLWMMQQCISSATNRDVFAGDQHRPPLQPSAGYKRELNGPRQPIGE